MSREVFGPGIFREESGTIEQIDKKRKRESKSKTSDRWEEEKQEQEDLKRLHEEAAAKYEEALGVTPPEDWTTERIIKAMDKKTEKERETRGWPKPWEIKRGHRKGEKSEKPKGGETISKKEAA